MNTKKNKGWFDVDKEGLAKLLEGRGKIALIHELIQNAWDTDTDYVDVTLEPVPGRPLATLEVRDGDPNGFADLAHAYTLFAESVKKGDAEKRGRFNLGEKLVLALCEEATVSSTTGTVHFHKDGTRQRTKGRTTEGSIFSAQIRMTRYEIDEIDALIDQLIPPFAVRTTFNGRVLEAPTPIVTFETSLPTVIGDDDGVLRRSRRKCEVAVYEVRNPTATSGLTGFIYEMGIPVVETGDTYDVDVCQKVPLNMDRDNVTPAYLRELRAAVLNALAAREGGIPEAVASEAWVTDAVSHDSVDDTAVRDFVAKRFGDTAVTYDPSDREANHTAAINDAPVVHGGALPKAAWANVKRADAMQPAGRAFPTQQGTVPGNTIDPHVWTDGMRRVAEGARQMASLLIDVYDLTVVMLDSPRATTMADYDRERRTLRFNVGHPLMGEDWFDTSTTTQLERVIDLIVHELAHHLESSHKSERYHEACTMLAGKLGAMVVTGGAHLRVLLPAGAPPPPEGYRRAAKSA
jgi:hypothetical protein